MKELIEYRLKEVQAEYDLEKAKKPGVFGTYKTASLSGRIMALEWVRWMFEHQFMLRTRPLFFLTNDQLADFQRLTFAECFDGKVLDESEQKRVTTFSCTLPSDKAKVPALRLEFIIQEQEHRKTCKYWEDNTIVDENPDQV